LKFSDFLKENKDKFSWPFKPPLSLDNGHPVFLPTGCKDISELSDYIQAKVCDAGKMFAYGGYLEERDLYRNEAIFGTGERRTIHLGLDIWSTAGTSVCMPVDGHIHSYRDNQHMYDYGPTIITRHTLAKETFYLLFGHLSRSSLQNIKKGTIIKKEDTLAELGTTVENGGWPPHLHFQIIKNIGNYEGDYPGVALKSKIDDYLDNCPDPMILFNK
jgi:murein DD-endopeptidase MepM/ murein hydrolase activator NlpD